MKICIAACLCAQQLAAQGSFSGLFASTADISRLKFDEIPTSYKTTYRNAIGIRAGGTSGITFKHFLNSSDAIEGILGLWPNAIGITVLYERNVGIQGAPGLHFYYGGGAHFNAATGDYYAYRDDYWYHYRHDGIGVGIDGIMGIEYKIPPIPMAISLDLKPFIEASNYGTFYAGFDPSIGIKVAF